MTAILWTWAAMAAMAAWCVHDEPPEEVSEAWLITIQVLATLTLLPALSLIFLYQRLVHVIDK